MTVDVSLDSWHCFQLDGNEIDQLLRNIINLLMCQHFVLTLEEG
jgi:hypothetical protein